jgi:Ca2+-binding RTX toxin-like protein
MSAHLHRSEQLHKPKWAGGLRRAARATLASALIASALAVPVVVAGPAAAGPPRPALSVSDASAVPEGNGGSVNLVFTVSMSGRQVHPVTVAYSTLDGTATAPADYTAVSGTLGFAKSGPTTQAVTVSANGDTEGEDAETFTLELSSPANATLADGSGTGAITDDDCTILGTAGNDVINGTMGNDVICGLDGVDVMNGLYGDDQIAGNAGSDRMVGGRGNDTINGGTDDDWVRYSGSPAGVTIDLSQGVASDDGLGGSDVLISTERAYGSKTANDDITGDDGDNVLSGLGGSDTLRGLGGNDRLLAGFGDDTIYGGEGDDRLEGNVGIDTCMDTSGTNRFLVCEVFA